jgi:hypothetical protein
MAINLVVTFTTDTLMTTENEKGTYKENDRRSPACVMGVRWRTRMCRNGKRDALSRKTVS